MGYKIVIEKLIVFFILTHTFRIRYVGEKRYIYKNNKTIRWVAIKQANGQDFCAEIYKTSMKVINKPK